MDGSALRAVPLTGSTPTTLSVGWITQSLDMKSTMALPFATTVMKRRTELDLSFGGLKQAKSPTSASVPFNRGIRYSLCLGEIPKKVG